MQNRDFSNILQFNKYKNVPSIGKVNGSKKHKVYLIHLRKLMNKELSEIRIHFFGPWDFHQRIRPPTRSQNIGIFDRQVKTTNNQKQNKNNKKQKIQKTICQSKQIYRKKGNSKIPGKYIFLYFVM